MDSVVQRFVSRGSSLYVEDCPVRTFAIIHDLNLATWQSTTSQKVATVFTVHKHDHLSLNKKNPKMRRFFGAVDSQFVATCNTVVLLQHWISKEKREAYTTLPPSHSRNKVIIPTPDLKPNFDSLQ